MLSEFVLYYDIKTSGKQVFAELFKLNLLLDGQLRKEKISEAALSGTL